MEVLGCLFVGGVPRQLWSKSVLLIGEGRRELLKWVVVLQGHPRSGGGIWCCGHSEPSGGWCG